VLDEIGVFLGWGMLEALKTYVALLRRFVELAVAAVVVYSLDIED